MQVLRLPIGGDTFSDSLWTVLEEVSKCINISLSASVSCLIPCCDPYNSPIKQVRCRPISEKEVVCRRVGDS